MTQITLPNGVLDITDGIIIHQVNCQNKFSAGLAKSIAEQYPIVKREYHAYMDKTPAQSVFGLAQAVRVNDRLTIVNLFSQYYYGNAARTGEIYTDYDKLINGIKEICKTHDETIYIPTGIGCGLAGGDWNYVSKELASIPNLTCVSLPKR